jgi:hypothetical protein
MLFSALQVQQILNWDEDGIRKAWEKANASAGRNPAEKDFRLAYLIWRVWCVRTGSVARLARRTRAAPLT